MLLGKALVHAQQESQFTNYMVNTTAINPAYTTQEKGLTLLGLQRNQWVGLDGAPVTTMLSGHTPLPFTNMTLGANIIHDKIGPTSETLISIDYAYALKLNKQNKLSFGLKASGSFFDLDYSQLNAKDNDDIQFNDRNLESLNPNIGMGIYYNTNKWYLGVSTPFLIETKREMNKDDLDLPSLSTIKRHYYLISGYVFDINKEVKLKTALLTKIVQGSPVSYDGSISVLLQNKITIGASYRHKAAISMRTGYQINPRMAIGYSYDFETTELARTNNGSHEFFLKYMIHKKTKKVLTPRFF